MVAPVSIMKAAKGWLFTQLTASLTPADAKTGLLVSYDSPGTYLPPDIVAVRNGERSVAAAGMTGSMGAGALQEQVDLLITIEVYRGGDNAQLVFERACDLVDATVAVVRADPTLGGVALRCAPLSVTYGEAAWTDDKSGRVCGCGVQVSAFALI